jgi:2-polyprenyl-3-methyl-5-hydroxy-6-metoxy-1,4-benzoquinol methylase
MLRRNLMTDQVVCPLSGSSDVVLVERIRASKLVELYARTLKIDVASEFNHYTEVGYYYCNESDLRFFSPAVVGSAAFYGKLQHYEWYYLQDKNEYEYAGQYVKQSDCVLDIGCGKGDFRQRIPTRRYIGLEMNQAAIVEGEKKGIQIINESVRQHSQKNAGKYEIVCAFQVLEHVSNVRAFVGAAALCVKPGGLLILSVPSYDSFGKYATNFSLDLPPHHVSRWSDKALQNIANIFSLAVVEIWHESLQLLHKQFYAQTIASHALRSIFGRPYLNVDLSLQNKLIARAGGCFGNLFAKGLTGPELLPRGISVTGVFRKPL